MIGLAFLRKVYSYFYFQTWNFGLWSPPDRKFLIKKILTGFGKDPKVKTVLFVGVQRYTRRYRKLFPFARFITLDYEPALKRFGAPDHISADVANLSDFRESHFREGIDLVVLNGVIGYGVDSKQATEKVISEIAKQLRPAGHFVIGFNPSLTPEIKLDELASLKDFFESVANRSEIQFTLPFHKGAVHQYSFYTRSR